MDKSEDVWPLGISNSPIQKKLVNTSPCHHQYHSHSSPFASDSKSCGRILSLPHIAFTKNGIWPANLNRRVQINTSRTTYEADITGSLRRRVFGTASCICLSVTCGGLKGLFVLDTNEIETTWRYALQARDDYLAMYSGLLVNISWWSDQTRGRLHFRILFDFYHSPSVSYLHDTKNRLGLETGAEHDKGLN